MFAIAHLTDIHIADSADPVLQRAGLIAAAIGGSCSQACKDVVLAITGDIAYSGESDQYELATSFFREIEQILQADYELSVHFAICPGNHDCNFDRDQEIRDLSLAAIFAGTQPSERLIEECTSVQENFFTFLGPVNTIKRGGDKREVDEEGKNHIQFIET